VSKERASIRRVGGLLPWLLLPLVVCAACLAGRYPMTAGDLLAILTAGLSGHDSGRPAAMELVVWDLRLPRVAAGLAIGAALGAAGATYQSLFRNPLVSPDILGVSAGASLGAVVAILLVLPAIAIQAAAFLGGLAAVGTVYLTALWVRGRDPLLLLVLAGVAVGSLFGAGVALVKVLADPYDQLPAITFWLLGSLAAVRGSDLLNAFGPLALGLAPLVLLRWRVNLMTLPEEEAKALGVPTAPLRVALVAGATLMTSAAVALAGVVGWIGLVVPHVARLLVGPDFRRLLPAAMALGGGFLVLVDTLARSVVTREIPLGVLTAGVGAPFFLWLLARARHQWA